MSIPPLLFRCFSPVDQPSKRQRMSGAKGGGSGSGATLESPRAVRFNDELLFQIRTAVGFGPLLCWWLQCAPIVSTSRVAFVLAEWRHHTTTGVGFMDGALPLSV